MTVVGILTTIRKRKDFCFWGWGRGCSNLDQDIGEGIRDMARS